jgi:hypothetical protein
MGAKRRIDARAAAAAEDDAAAHRATTTAKGRRARSHGVYVAGARGRREPRERGAVVARRAVAVAEQQADRRLRLEVAWRGEMAHFFHRLLTVHMTFPTGQAL